MVQNVGSRGLLGTVIVESAVERRRVFQVEVGIVDESEVRCGLKIVVVVDSSVSICGSVTCRSLVFKKRLVVVEVDVHAVFVFIVRFVGVVCVVLRAASKVRGCETVDK